MSKTNKLKKLVQSLLEQITDEVSFEIAREKELYPHVVFSFQSVNSPDLNRDDVYIDVDVWDKGTSTELIEDICDDIEKTFKNLNEPQDTILPTFYIEGRKSVADQDKTIKHRLLNIVAQTYEKE